jgi:hypothetical protein
MRYLCFGMVSARAAAVGVYEALENTANAN